MEKTVFILLINKYSFIMLECLTYFNSVMENS